MDRTHTHWMLTWTLLLLAGLPLACGSDQPVEEEASPQPGAMPLPVSTSTPLPPAGQAIVVPGYPERAKGEHTLDWEKRELGRFAIPRPIHNEWEQSAVVARFDKGWEFVCLFITPDADPRCAEVIQIPMSEEE